MAQEQQAISAPICTISVNGTELSSAARGDVMRVIVEESLDCAATFAIELNDWDPQQQDVKWGDDPLFQPGGVVEIKMGYVEAEEESVMKGEITGLQMAFTDRSRSVLTVRGYDRLHRFRRGRRTRSHMDVSDSDVATAIANDLGLTPDAEDSGEVHSYLQQVNQTDIDFLLTRARAIGYELLVEDKKLIFRKRKHGSGKTLTLDPLHGLITIYARLSTADQVSKVVVRGWDPKAKQAVVGQAQATDVKSMAPDGKTGPAATESLFGAQTLTLVEMPVATQNEADLLANGLLNERALGYVVAEGTARGDPAIKVGTVIELAKLGKKFSGPYYVTQVEQKWDGDFVTSFALARNAA